MHLATTDNPRPTLRSSPSLLAPTIGVIVLAAILRFIFLISLDFYLMEDALITMRYAQNIAHGKGFVYNPGEHVLGTTTPFYTIILAGVEVLGLGALRFGPILNLICALLSILLIFLWLTDRGRPKVGVLAAAFVGLCPKFIFISIGGMETGLYVLASTVSLYAISTKRYGIAAVALSTTILIRPDGLLLALAMLCWYILVQRAIPWRLVAISTAVLIPWIVFATLYFGSPIPNSVTAKLVAYGQCTSLLTSTERVFTTVWKGLFGPWIGALVGLGFLVGCCDAVRRKRRLLVAAIWVVLHFAAMALSRPTRFFPWYFVAPIAAYGVVSALGIASLAQAVSGVLVSSLGRKGHRLASAAAILTLLASLVALTASLQDQYGQVADWASYERTQRRVIGDWLRENTPPNSTVLLEPLGYIGYYSQRHIMDLVGLVSPQVYHMRSQTPLEHVLGDIVCTTAPDYLVRVRCIPDS